MSRMSYEDAIAGGHWSPSESALEVDRYLEASGPETNPENWTFSGMGGWKYVGPDVGKSSRQEYAEFITDALSRENHPNNPNNLFGEYTSWGYDEGSPVITEPGSGVYLGPNWRTHFINDLVKLQQFPDSDPTQWKRYDVFKGYEGVNSQFNQSPEFRKFLSDANWKMDWDRNRVLQEWENAARDWERSQGITSNLTRSAGLPSVNPLMQGRGGDMSGNVAGGMLDTASRTGGEPMRAPRAGGMPMQAPRTGDVSMPAPRSGGFLEAYNQRREEIGSRPSVMSLLQDMKDFK